MFVVGVVEGIDSQIDRRLDDVDIVLVDKLPSVALLGADAAGTSDVALDLGQFELWGHAREVLLAPACFAIQMARCARGRSSKLSTVDEFSAMAIASERFHVVVARHVDDMISPPRCNVVH